MATQRHFMNPAVGRHLAGAVREKAEESKLPHIFIHHHPHGHTVHAHHPTGEHEKSEHAKGDIESVLDKVREHLEAEPGGEGREEEGEELGEG